MFDPKTLARRLLGSVPTSFVLAALAGLAFWGHHTGWRMPRFAALTGAAAVPDDWCPAHAVPESVCVECRPDLFPKQKAHAFCKTHGVAECPFCYPEIAQLPVTAKVTTADLDRARRAMQFAERVTNDSKCKKHLRRLQFASVDAAEKAGIQTEPVVLAPVVEAVSGNGEIMYDQTRTARLSSRMAGTVWRVERQLGDPVRQGDILALVDAAEVGKARAEFLQAYAQVEFKGRLVESMKNGSSSIPLRTLQEAEAALREARIRLLGAQQALVNLGLQVALEDLKGLSEEKLARTIQLLGLPESLTANLDARTISGNLLPLRAPIDGVVVSREGVAGEVVDASKVLFVVADPHSLWLDLHVRLEDARLLKLGQTVHFRPDGRTSAALSWYTVIGDKLTWNQTLEGRVTWISPAVDERTRTVTVRAAFADADGRLRAGTFGKGRIVLRQESAIVVPKEAVQWEGCCHVVFVQDRDYHVEGAPKVFHVREVVPGATDDTTTELIAGVLPGEVVVTKGASVLRAELLKNDLGEG